MSLQVDSSYQLDPQVDKTDLQDQKCDTAELPNERILGLPTLDSGEGANKSQEGGIQGWAAMIGA